MVRKNGVSPDLMQLSASNCPEHVQKLISKPEFLQECQTLIPKKQTDFHLSPLGCSLLSTCWLAGVSESCVSGRQLQVLSTNVHMARVTQPFFLHCCFGRSKVQGRHCTNPFMCNTDPNESDRVGTWAWDNLMTSVKYKVDGVLRIGSQLWVLTLYIFNRLKSYGFAACRDGPTITSKSSTEDSEHSDPSASQSGSSKKMWSKYFVYVGVQNGVLSDWVCFGFPSKLRPCLTSTAFLLVSQAVSKMGPCIVEAGAGSWWSEFASIHPKLLLIGNFAKTAESFIV